MKRCFDLALVGAALVLLAVPLLVVALLVRLTSRGPILYWSDRVGRNNTIFRMPKFRSMRVGTPAVATHLLDNPDRYLTPIGSFLRTSSLDELPQLWSVLIGDMSFVGPRPALFNQDDLIALRTEYGVHELMPGVTGWAQVNGRDELPIPEKVKLDVEYLQRRSLRFDVSPLIQCILEHPQPGADRQVGIIVHTTHTHSSPPAASGLPGEEGPFRVGHQGQVAAVG
jgi:O-antigen biosynthesis protein WbqP